jgi:hypothetical protein
MPVAEMNAASKEFSLVEVLRSLGIRRNRDVFINWKRFECIDRIALEDLSRYFDDIFYPGPDDIELFDETLKWFMLVDHEGAISITEL